MVTAQQDDGSGGEELAEGVRARGTDKESGMTGQEQITKLRKRLDRRKRGTRIIGLCGGTTCGTGEPNHGGTLKRLAIEHLRRTAITGDMANAEVEHNERTDATEREEDTRESGNNRGEGGQSELGNKETEQETGGNQRARMEPEGRENIGREGGNQERRKGKQGPKRSRAADGDVIGLVHLLRYMHGYQRPMSKGTKQEMKDTKCGKPWEKQDTIGRRRGTGKESAETGREERFESDQEEETGDRTRNSRAESARERLRDEEWERQNYRERVEEEEEECEVEIAAAAVAAGGDDELYDRLTSAARDTGECAGVEMRQDGTNERKNDQQQDDVGGEVMEDESGKDEKGKQREEIEEGETEQMDEGEVREREEREETEEGATREERGYNGEGKGDEKRIRGANRKGEAKRAAKTQKWERRGTKEGRTGPEAGSSKGGQEARKQEGKREDKSRRNRK